MEINELENTIIDLEKKVKYLEQALEKQQLIINDLKSTVRQLEGW